MRIVLATRGSPLALWQAEEARRLLGVAHPTAEIELSIVRSTGDDDARLDLASIGRTGVFTAEIDRAVREGTADVGVHSLKDMTTTLDEGFVLGGTLARAAAEDALVSRTGERLADLRAGARVATGSVRRIAMLKRARHDLEVVGMRGNVDTRLEKLARGEADALLVACAGLVRLGLGHRITEVLAAPAFLPAVGQGIVGLTCRADDQRTVATLASISDREAWAEALAERALLRGLHGGCNAPVGARARAVENGISIRASVLSVDGTRHLEGERSGSIGEAERIGTRLAEELAARGAKQLIEAARAR
ncbi:MAG TPA: hydroxymethylbilane synthase [Planctomycetota bacterium]|nr:hydroxymethylbilane synthase [Planctomycetota bacterium]